MKTNSSIVLSSLLAVVSMVQVVIAQDTELPSGLTTTLTTEGVSGDRDKKDREPTLSVTTIVPDASEENQKVRILAYAEVMSHEFKRYPIRYDFYVDRHLHSTQMRSEELTGPVGIEVGEDVATLPFNYSVVATLLHPNRQFTTVLHGAIFATDLTETLDCTVTIAASSEDDGSIYQVASTESLQRGNNVIGLQFEATAADGEEEAEVDATITLASSPTVDTSSDVNATAEITTSVDGISTPSTLSGTVTFASGVLSEIDLVSQDDLVALSCSSSADVQ